jgi:hypothetical protein
MITEKIGKMERGSRLPWGAGAGTASRPAQPGVRDSVGKAIEIKEPK